MITYAPWGKLPAGLSAPLLRRIGRSFRGVRKVPRVGVVGVRFVTASEMQRLNKRFRKKDRPTDVLSFSAREGTAFPRTKGEEEMGDLVICPSVARAEARRRAMDVQEELVRLIAHGTLHLAGYDHATEEEERVMFGMQERIVAAAL